MNQTVRVGDKVRDVITGLEGIATSRTVWINGCVRVGVQPQEIKDGKAVDASVFDEEQLVVLQRGAVAAEPEHTPDAAGPVVRWSEASVRANRNHANGHKPGATTSHVVVAN